MIHKIEILRGKNTGAFVLSINDIRIVGSKDDLLSIKKFFVRDSEIQEALNSISEYKKEKN